MSASPRFLLVTRAGKASLHGNWLGQSEPRGFDVYLSAYDPAVAPVSGPGVFFEHRPGYKVEGYSGFLRDHAALWQSYDHVCFWDEDLDASAETLRAMFEICAAHRLKIAQPALTADSHYTYAAFLRQPAWTLRHVNFIEMMCPVFRTDILDAIAPLYHSKYESGIDLVWCHHVGTDPTDFAVIDATPVRHTEPVGGKMTDNGFVQTSGYTPTIYEVMRRFNVPWSGCVALSGVTRSGKTVQSPALLFLAALTILRAVPLQRPMAGRLRAVLVHFKHLAEAALGRPPKRDLASIDT